VRELAEVFLADAPRMLEAIRASLAAGDAPALAHAAHALKGSVANFAAAEATGAALELERLARAGAPNEARAGALGPARAAHRRVEEEVARVCQALRAMVAESPRSARSAAGGRRGTRVSRGT